MFHLLALALYLLHLAGQLRYRPAYPKWLFFPLLAGLLVQSVYLAQSLISVGAFDFFEVISLAGLGCVLTVLALQLIGSKCAFLQLWFVPVVCLTIVADFFFDNTYLPPNINVTGLVLHVLLSIMALSLVSVSSVLLFCGLVRDYQLKHPENSQWSIPLAMETLKKLSRSFLLIAWVTLSLAVVSGLVFIEHFLQQHLAHKTFFTVLAWLLLTFLLMRLRQHTIAWKRLFILCLLVNISLVLGYFGTRFVLEFIL